MLRSTRPQLAVKRDARSRRSPRLVINGMRCFGSRLVAAFVACLLVEHGRLGPLATIMGDASMPTIRLEQSQIAGVLLLVAVLAIACETESTRPISAPGSSLRSVSSQGSVLNQLPDPDVDLPALDLRTVAREVPRALSDSELVRQVVLADGNVLVGLKPAGAPRTGRQV